jgi:hypothetical protein
MTRYVATINTPGYLPIDDDPPVFDTAREAWWYLYEELIDEESNHPCPLCYGESTHGISGDCDDDSEAAREIGQAARTDQTGTVYGPTPGYDGDHDLGLAYSVSIAE